MNRLVQGDVGSGKTMVAAAAIYMAAKNGLQCALMAPTEILAEQHYRSLAPLLEPLGIPCALLTASTKARERRALNERLRSGELSLVIGTHALLSPDVQYQTSGSSSPTSSTASASTSAPRCPPRATTRTCSSCLLRPSRARLR